MGFRRVLKLIIGLLLLAILVLVGVSGPYREAPWIVSPLLSVSISAAMYRSILTEK